MLDMTKKRKAKKESVPISQASNPTQERLKKAGTDYKVGDDRQGRVVVQMCDTPLERMFERDKIGAVEYAALNKYRHHWYYAGLEAGVGSVDLDRAHGSDPTGMSGMAKSEGQAYHRQQWRRARECLGHRSGIIVDNVVCQEHSLEIAGFAIGWSNRPQAVAAATESLCDAGGRLAKLWGLG